MKRALILILFAGCLWAALSESESASRKVQRLERGKLRAPARVTFTPGELNAWVRDEARYWTPEGARHLHLQLASDQATGSADIDFLKLRHAVTGQEAGWLMKNLFSGERPVTVRAHFESRDRRARVDVERVEISGVPIEGRALEFLIENYLRPTFPEAKVGEWFRLGYNVDHFAVSPSGVVVVIGTPRQIQ